MQEVQRSREQARRARVAVQRTHDRAFHGILESDTTSERHHKGRQSRLPTQPYRLPEILRNAPSRTLGPRSWPDKCHRPDFLDKLPVGIGPLNRWPVHYHLLRADRASVSRTIPRTRSALTQQ